MRYIGVDVGKRRCRACVMDEEGSVVDEFPFTNDAGSIETLLGRLPTAAAALWSSLRGTCG